MLRARGERGLALVSTLLMLPVVVGLSYCLAAIGIQCLNLAQGSEHSRRAAYVAQAGASAGIAQVKANSSYSGSFTLPMLSLSETAQVTVLNNVSGSTSVYASNGARVPVGFAYVLAGCTTSDGRVTRYVGALVKGGGFSPFQQGLATANSMSATGHPLFDSFDSRLGVAPGPNGAGGATEAHQGNVLSKGTFSLGGATITGTLSYVTSVYPNNAAVPYSGTPGMGFANTTNPSGFSMPDVQMPMTPTSLVATGTLTPSTAYGTLSGSATIGSGGIYVFSSMPGILTISASVTTPVQIYIQGTRSGNDFNMMGIVNNIPSTLASKDTLLQIYCASNVTDSISANGQSNPVFYGAVYAPSASYTQNGNNQYYGAFTFGSYTKHGSSGGITFDAALKSVSTGGGTPTVTARQRF